MYLIAETVPLTNCNRQCKQSVRLVYLLVHMPDVKFS
jgi:hypothetical protein